MKTYAWIGIASLASAIIAGLFVIWATQTANANAAEEETMAWVYCTAGAQYCNGSAASEVIVGSAGYDNIRGWGGNDNIYGNGGSDKITGGAGYDKGYGVAGNDTFYWRDCRGEPIDGGPGTDTAYADVSDWYVGVENRGEAHCV